MFSPKPSTSRSVARILPRSSGTRGGGRGNRRGEVEPHPGRVTVLDPPTRGESIQEPQPPPAVVLTRTDLGLEPRPRIDHVDVEHRPRSADAHLDGIGAAETRVSDAVGD